MQNEGATQGFRDDPLAEPVRWWRRSPANTSTLSKAVCVMAASFALTAVLGGTYPTHALAVDEAGGQAAVASAASDGADSAASAHGPTDVGSSGEGAVGAAHVTTATEGSSAESDNGTGSQVVASSSTDQRRQTMGAMVSQTVETHVEAPREEAETARPRPSRLPRHTSRRRGTRTPMTRPLPRGRTTGPTPTAPPAPRARGRLPTP